MIKLEDRDGTVEIDRDVFELHEYFPARGRGLNPRPVCMSNAIFDF
jgi:hypothetical protein